MDAIFDGACSKNGSCIGVIIETLKSKIHPHAFKFQFECTNNEAEYEALIKGLELTMNMGIRCLYVFGDSRILINQIKNKYGIKKRILKAYTRKVWDLIENFQAFNITLIHRKNNHKEYSLALFVSMFVLDSSEK